MSKRISSNSKYLTIIVIVVVFVLCGIFAPRTNADEPSTTELSNNVELSTTPFVDDNWKPRSAKFATTTTPEVEVAGVQVERQVLPASPEPEPPTADHEDVPPVTIEPWLMPDVGEVEAYILQVWTEAGYGWDAAKAVRVARCESGLRPDARNGSHYGIFQIQTDDPSMVPYLYDYRYNIENAIDMYIASGWSQHWRATRHC